MIRAEKHLLTTTKIWDRAKVKGDTKVVNTKLKTPTATLAAQHYVDVRDRQRVPTYQPWNKVFRDGTEETDAEKQYN